MISPESQSLPIPQNAKKVFGGVLFDVYQWEQKMYDGSTALFEKARRADSVQVIATIDGKILIQDQLQPDYKKSRVTIPGGRVDNPGDPLAEAKRELLEEEGLESLDWILWKESPYTGKVVATTYYYIARNCHKTREPHFDGGEKITSRLVSFDDFMMLSDNPQFWTGEDFISDLLRMRLDEQKKENFWRELFG